MGHRAVEQGAGSSFTQILYGPTGNKVALMNAGTATMVKAFIPLPTGALAVYGGATLGGALGTQCAQEGGTCSFTGTKVIAYGANGSYVYQIATDGTPCANYVFGDPIFGTPKYCYIQSSALAYFRHSDYLGSARLSTTLTTPTTAYSEVSYAPFGETYNLNGTSDKSYTGQNQDTASGLYDFLYREQNLVQGRWISPDPSGLNAVDLANPQSWNRYVYVGNDPLRSIDPLGLQCVTGDDGSVADDGSAPPCDHMTPATGVFDVTSIGFDIPMVNRTDVLSSWGIRPVVMKPPYRPMTQFRAGQTGQGSITESKKCTALQAEAKNLAAQLKRFSDTTGNYALGFGVITAAAGLGEAPSGGADTPGTLTAASVTTFFATASTLTDGLAAGLESYAAGNNREGWTFGAGQLANFAAKAGASKIPFIKPYAETAGDLAERLTSLALQSKDEGCVQ